MSEPQDPAAYIMHHVQDHHDWELPGSGNMGLAHEYDIHEALGRWVVNVGGHELDLTPTKFTLNMFLAAFVVLAVLLWSMRKRGAVPKGRLQTSVEMMFLFVRDEIAEKNIGHHSEKYVPYLATCFFFILTMNMMGLLPWLSPATSSVSLTIVLAAATWVMTQLAGMRNQGVAGYWLHLVPAGVPWWLYPLMIPVEIIGLFTKPFALMMRLFANMMAGHIVMFFLIGLMFFMHTYAIGVIGIPFTVGIFLLELFVALIQAYVFTILSAVFIGLASHSH
jgi:F-type H+-transporting ATPase subunit a